MIPCYVCGKDASAGWTIGFAPAPDSQKLALCPMHDSPDKRKEVERAWGERLAQDLAAYAQVTEHKAAPVKMLATVFFSGGGMLSFTCTAVTPTEHGTLRIEQLDGTQTFLPMQHVREYSVRPFLPDETGQAGKKLSLE